MILFVPKLIIRACLGALMGMFLSSTVLAGTISAALDRDSISLGETVTLTVTYTGNAQSAPAIPGVANLAITSAGRSSQISLINGTMTSSLIFSYQVQPSQVGDYVIPQIQGQVDNAILKTAPLRLKVTKEAPGGAAAKFAFLKLVVPKNQVYVGELIPIDVQLYVQAGQDLQRPQLRGDAFVIGKQAEHTQTRTQIGPNVYNVLSFKMSVAAAKAGKLNLGPAECSLTLRIPSSNRRRNDPMDQIPDPFEFFSGGRTELRQVTLTSDAQPMEVFPVPRTNVPPGFNGALGNFSFAVTASPTNVTAGDPVTLHIRVQGKGTLDALALPNLGWGEFKVYPPNSTVTNTDALGLEGVKTFEEVVVPQNAEVKEIPSISFSFFDPEQKRYKVINTAPIPLHVAPGALAPAQPTIISPGVAKDQQPEPARDIVHIKTHVGVVGPLSPVLLQQPWFIGLQGIPFLAWISATVWQRRKDRLARDPRLRRRLQVEKVVAEGVKNLSTLAAANQTEEFFATVFHLLQEQVGERLNVPSSAITEAVVDEKFLTSHAPTELIGEIQNLFQICNQARYARQRTSQELLSLIPKIQGALDGLKKIPVRE